MTTTVKKWGNSLGLRLPKNIAELMEIKDGTNISINLNDGTIEITKIQENIELDSFLLGINEENMHNEISSNTPIGKEVW